MKPLEIKGARLGWDISNSIWLITLVYRLPPTEKRRVVSFGLPTREKVKVTKLLELTPAQMNDFLFDGELPIGSAN